jgi:hypothetical protein
MIHETFFSESFKSDSDQEEEMLKIFSPFPQKLDLEKEDSLDDLIYVTKPPLNKDISPLGIKAKIQVSNENDLLIMDDYDDLYNQILGKNEANSINENIDIDKPLFVSDFNIHENRFKSPIIEEKEEIFIHIENFNLEFEKPSKENIFLIEKEKNNSNIYKNESKQLSLKIQNSPKKKPKRKSSREQKEQKALQDEYFPFTPGKGIINCSFNSSEPPPSTGIPSSSDSSQESKHPNRKNLIPPNKERHLKFESKNNKGSNKDESKEESVNEETYNGIDHINTPNDFIFKFKTKKYFVSENGKRKRVKKKRKFKPDDIRKKIKARFHKAIKNIINENLKKAGSKELFDFLPQCFIGNISKKTNSKCLELTYKELLSTDFIRELNKQDYKNSSVDYNKYKKNLQVLNYLENNPDICQRSGFDLIKDRKYKDILKIYFSSAQFENSLIQLKAEKESSEYIQEYINKASTYISFYSKANMTPDKKTENESEDEEDEEEDINEK